PCRGSAQAWIGVRLAAQRLRVILLLRVTQGGPKSALEPKASVCPTRARLSTGLGRSGRWALATVGTRGLLTAVPNRARWSLHVRIYSGFCVDFMRARLLAWAPLTL